MFKRIAEWLAGLAGLTITDACGAKNCVNNTGEACRRKFIHVSQARKLAGARHSTSAVCGSYMLDRNEVTDEN